MDQQSNVAARVVYRYLRAKSKSVSERKPIDVAKGYHITPSKYLGEMLEKGVTPRSKGNFKGEFERNKTYFFRSLEDAVESMLDYMRAEGRPLTFDSTDPHKLPQGIVEFDLKHMDAFADPEMPDEAGFITKKLPNSAINLVKFKDWESAIVGYGKKHKVKVSLPSDDSDSAKTSENDAAASKAENPRLEKSVQQKSEKPGLIPSAPKNRPKRKASLWLRIRNQAFSKSAVICKFGIRTLTVAIVTLWSS